MNPVSTVSTSLRATVPQVALIAPRERLEEVGLVFSHVLFLDIDGVLHPEMCQRHDRFCFAPHFEHALREADPNGQVPIVISSDWRLDTPLPQLAQHFTAHVARQIVGVTPDLLNVPHTTRRTEVEAWMGEHAPRGRWLALDDRPHWFGEDCPHVFGVPRQGDRGLGLTKVLVRTFAHRLERFLAEAPAAAPGARP